MGIFVFSFELSSNASFYAELDFHFLTFFILPYIYITQFLITFTLYLSIFCYLSRKWGILWLAKDVSCSSNETVFLQQTVIKSLDWWDLVHYHHFHYIKRLPSWHGSLFNQINRTSLELHFLHIICDVL